MSKRPPPPGWRQAGPPPETEPPPQGWAECSGAFRPSDNIRFEETVWRSGKKIGARVITGLVLDPEDPDVLEHWKKSKPSPHRGDGWVYLEVVGCEGDDASEVLQLLAIRRKRTTVERNGVIRMLRLDENPAVP